MTQHDSFNDPFEDDVRRALRAEAPGHAPDRLHGRIAASRRRVPIASSRSGTGIRAWAAAGFGTVAIAATLIVALTLRPGPLGPAASSGASAAAETPAASGAVATGAAQTPPASPSASAGPVVGTVPADFRPVSVTFVSPTDGWTLGTTGCTTGGGTDCAAIARTTDGGATWGTIPAPATTVTGAARGSSGVTSIRFATALDGWAFGPELWATHDGGSTWHRIALPATSPTVMALEASAGRVHAALFDQADAGVIRIASSDVTSDAWNLSPLRVTLGAGPVPQPQLVLHGSSGWLVEVDRTVVSGAHLTGGSWQSWTPPCATSIGPALLTAASDRDLAAACDVGLWAAPTGVHLYRSGDAGATFAAVGGRLPISGIEGVTMAAGSPETVVVAGRIGDGAALVGSFDGGRTWATVMPPVAGVTIADLGFTTATQGVAVLVAESGASRLVMTTDGGRTWQPVTIGS